MGLSCAKVVRNSLSSDKESETFKLSVSDKQSEACKPSIPDKQSENCRQIYLCNNEGEEVTSLQMRGLPETRPELTPETLEIIITSWAEMKKDIEHVGVVMFVGLLEDNYEVKSTFVHFEKMNETELRASTQLRSHVLRVMEAVDKAVSRLHEPEKLVAFLHQLGQRHVQYNTRPEFLDLIGPQFNNAVLPAMGDKWTPEREQAWADLFRYITHIMKETMIM